MTPPKEINVLDRHNGFTAITKRAYNRTTEKEAILHGDTCWRPGGILRQSTVGTLRFYAPGNWQGNKNVTIAIYRVPGYGYPVALWFDNETDKRIA